MDRESWEGICLRNQPSTHGQPRTKRPCPVQCFPGVQREFSSLSPVFMIENILPRPKRVLL